MRWENEVEECHFPSHSPISILRNIWLNSKNVYENMGAGAPIFWLTEIKATAKRPQSQHLPVGAHHHLR